MHSDEKEAQSPQGITHHPSSSPKPLTSWPSFHSASSPSPHASGDDAYSDDDESSEEDESDDSDDDDDGPPSPLRGILKKPRQQSNTSCSTFTSFTTLSSMSSPASNDCKREGPEDPVDEDNDEDDDTGDFFERSVTWAETLAIDMATGAEAIPAKDKLSRRAWEAKSERDSFLRVEDLKRAGYLASIPGGLVTVVRRMGWVGDATSENDDQEHEEEGGSSSSWETIEDDDETRNSGEPSLQFLEEVAENWNLRVRCLIAQEQLDAEKEKEQEENMTLTRKGEKEKELRLDSALNLPVS